MPEPGAIVLAMRYVFQPQMVGKDPETFEAGVREQVFEVCVRDGHLTTREGVLAAPATVITTDIEALHSMLMEGRQAADALAAGWAAVKGDEGALGCFLGMFRFPQVPRQRDRSCLELGSAR